MESHIIINGSNAEQCAKAIAAFYDTTYSEITDSPEYKGSYRVECNEQLENDLCIDEETAKGALISIESQTGVSIDIDDIEF